MPTHFDNIDIPAFVMFKAFITHHLMFEADSFLSTEEIDETFIRATDLRLDTLDTHCRLRYMVLRSWLDNNQPTEGREILIAGVKSGRREFPSRAPELKQRRGYVNLAWRPSAKLAAVVNRIRAQYKNRGELPDIQSVPSSD